MKLGVRIVPRRVLTVGILVALATLAPLPTAQALIIQPVIRTILPEFWDGHPTELRWRPSFNEGLGRRYRIRFDDEFGDAIFGDLWGSPVGDTFETIYIPGPVPPLVDGRRYTVVVEAYETQSPGMCMPCIIDKVDSAPATMTVDRTPPTIGSASINSGALFTSNRDVLVTLASVVDPIPTTGPRASGVRSVQTTSTGTFECSAANSAAADCPNAYTHPVPARIEGPDGLRTVSVRVRDGARPFRQPCITLICPFPGPNPVQGHASNIVSDTIVLDTTAPTIALTQSSTSIPAGLPVTFDALGTVDGANGDLDSGIDLAGFRWRFGDGGAAIGPTAAHRYLTPGRVTGEVEARDRLGNVATRSFSVTVGNPVVGKLRKRGSYRARRVASAIVDTTAPTTFTATLKRGRKLVRRFVVSGGPGDVRIAFAPRTAGRHTLTVDGGGVTRRLVFTVQR